MANLLNNVFSYLDFRYEVFVQLNEVDIKKSLIHVGIMKINGINVKDMSKKDIVSFLEKHYSLTYNYDTKYPNMYFEYYTHFNCGRPFKVCIETFSDMNFVEVSIYTYRRDEYDEVTKTYKRFSSYIKLNNLSKLHVKDVFVPRSNNLERFIGSSILVNTKDNGYILVCYTYVNFFETENKITHFFSDDAGGSGCITLYMRDSENWYYFMGHGDDLELIHDKHNLLNDVRCVGFYYELDDMPNGADRRRYKFFESRLNKSDDIKNQKLKLLYGNY